MAAWQEHANELKETVRALRGENQRLAAEVALLRGLQDVPSSLTFPPPPLLTTSPVEPPFGLNTALSQEGLRHAAGQGVAAPPTACPAIAIHTTDSDGIDGQLRHLALHSPQPSSTGPVLHGEQNNATSKEALRRISLVSNRNSTSGREEEWFAPIRYSTKASLGLEEDWIMPEEDGQTKNRIRILMGLDSLKVPVGSSEVQAVLKKKKVLLADGQVKAILREMRRIGKSYCQDGPHIEPLARATVRSDDMTGETFVAVLRMPNLASNFEDPTLTQGLYRMQQAFFSKTASEVIESVANRNIVRTRRDTEANPIDDEEENRNSALRCKQRILMVANSAAYITIILSVLKLGAELDNSPDSIVWAYVEGVFACIFLAEFITKNVLEGPRTYFCGADRYWNWLDAFITFVSLFEAGMSIIGSDQTAARITILMRMLRLCRAARLIKLLRAPFLREVASMLEGVLIGAPWLFWSTVLLGIFVYILGMGYRRAVGPGPDDTLLIPKCGLGDDIKREFMNSTGYTSNDECPIHILLGEEYFGTVEDSMFTVFRCLIGDCSTRMGQSLVVHLGNGYGWRFYASYYLGMTTAIFGLFNLITAMFVESTLSGLKNSEIKKRYSKMSESRYVKRKLHAFVARVNYVLAIRRDTRDSKNGEDADENHECTTLKYEEYVDVMQDFKAMRILEDLDVEAASRDKIFAMTDLDGNGIISMSNLVETIVRMRGDLRKSDIVANWFVVRNLQGRFETVEMLLQSVSRQILEHQKTSRQQGDALPAPSVAFHASGGMFIPPP